MPRCSFEWKSGKNFISPHICYLSAGHEGLHECSCGYKLGDISEVTSTDTSIQSEQRAI